MIQDNIVDVIGSKIITCENFNFSNQISIFFGITKPPAYQVNQPKLVSLFEKNQSCEYILYVIWTFEINCARINVENSPHRFFTSSNDGKIKIAIIILIFIIFIQFFFIFLYELNGVIKHNDYYFFSIVTMTVYTFSAYVET